MPVNLGRKRFRPMPQIKAFRENVLVNHVLAWRRCGRCVSNLLRAQIRERSKPPEKENPPAPKSRGVPKVPMIDEAIEGAKRVFTTRLARKPLFRAVPREAVALNVLSALLLSLVTDEATIKEIKKRLTPSQRADLFLEIVNPHRPLSTEQKAALAGVTASGIRKRKQAKPRGEK